MLEETYSGRKERKNIDANGYVVILFLTVSFGQYSLPNLTLCYATGFCKLKYQMKLQEHLIAEHEALYGA